MKLKAITFSVLMAAAMTVFYTSCTKSNDTTPTQNTTNTAAKTLYDSLGGINAISAVTDQFLTNVVADNVINSRFAATVSDSFRLRLLRQNLIEQICSASGGPCQYLGKTMMQAHKGMNISSKEFGALVGDLSAALDKFNVSAANKNSLLTKLGALESQIVGQ